MAKKTEKLPGSLYQRNDRWWWRVKLPGETDYKARPLIALGSQHAYKGDKAVAVEIAKAMLHEAIFKSAKEPHPQLDGTIAGLVKAYLIYADDMFRKPDGSKTKYPQEIRETMRPLVEYCGILPVEEFSPQVLMEFRKHLSELTRKKGKGEKMKIVRRYCLNTINKKITIIKTMFGWAVSLGHVHPSTHHGLLAIRMLKPGQYGLVESPEVEPVPEEHVLATLPFLTKVLADMVLLQYHTGMRSIELTGMKPCNVETDTEGGLWLYHVPQLYNKNARFGEKHKRVVPIGPKGQKILQKYLFRDKDSFCFSPKESEKLRLAENHKQRVTPMNQGHKPKEDNVSHIGDKYDSASYGKAVKRAIMEANKARKKGEPGIPKWTVYQLRHSAATNIAEELGLDAARVILGHRNFKTTKIYVKEDIKKIAKNLRRIG